MPNGSVRNSSWVCNTFAFWTEIRSSCNLVKEVVDVSVSEGRYSSSEGKVRSKALAGWGCMKGGEM